MSERDFFTNEMGARLRKLRLAAMLTQDDVADRMGLKGKWRKMKVRRLESGRVRNPFLKTVNLFLQACGAGWSDISDLLMKPPSVPIDLKPIADAGFRPEITQRLEKAAKAETEEFIWKTRYRGKGKPTDPKPLHPAKRQRVAERMRNYRMVAQIIEWDVRELIWDLPVSVWDIAYLRDVAREVLGLLWQRVKSDAGRREIAARSEEPPTALSDKFTERRWYWQSMGLDRDLVMKIQQQAYKRFGWLLETHPELFVRDENGIKQRPHNA
jgi:transcriptional regulator with XRE-family HTH domain